MKWLTLVALMPSLVGAVTAPPDCTIVWDYPASENRHIGFQIFDEVDGKMWDSLSNPGIRSVACAEVGLVEGQTYRLAVRAFNAEMASAFSEPLELIIDSGVLNAPTNFRLQ